MRVIKMNRETKKLTQNEKSTIRNRPERKRKAKKKKLWFKMHLDNIEKTL